MNIVVSFDWWRNTITVAFSDCDAEYYFPLGNVSSDKGARERMRRELRKETGIVLTRLNFWKTDGSVDYYRAKRVEKEN